MILGVIIFRFQKKTNPPKKNDKKNNGATDVSRVSFRDVFLSPGTKTGGTKTTVIGEEVAPTVSQSRRRWESERREDGGGHETFVMFFCFFVGYVTKMPCGKKKC